MAAPACVNPEADAGTRPAACAEPFLEPVRWKEWGLEDYPKVIKNPMDLGTVAVRARMGRARWGRVWAGRVGETRMCA